MQTVCNGAKSRPLSLNIGQPLSKVNQTRLMCTCEAARAHNSTIIALLLSGHIARIEKLVGQRQKNDQT